MSVDPADQESELVWHYTDMDGLLGITKDHQMWASQLSSLNDTSELDFGARLMRYFAPVWAQEQGTEQSQTVAAAVAVMDPERIRSAVYVLCTSTDGDLLSQWTNYGQGVAIGLDVAQWNSAQSFPKAVGFPNSNDVTPLQSDDVFLRWREVIYDEDAQKRFILGNFSALSRIVSASDSAGDIDLDRVRIPVRDIDFDRDIDIGLVNARARLSARARARLRGRDIDRDIGLDIALALILNPKLDLDTLVKMLLHTIAATLKHRGFKSEAEVRLLTSSSRPARAPEYRTRNGLLVPYIRIGNHDDAKPVKLPIHRVRVGPPASKYTLAAVKELLIHRGYGNVVDADGVDVSTIPYR